MRYKGQFTSYIFPVWSVVMLTYAILLLVRGTFLHHWFVSFAKHHLNTLVSESQTDQDDIMSHDYGNNLSVRLDCLYKSFKTFLQLILSPLNANIILNIRLHNMQRY